MTPEQDEINDIPVVNGPTRNALEERQIVDYTEHQRCLLKWSIHVGKTPEKAGRYTDSRTRELTIPLGPDLLTPAFVQDKIENH
jgi:hypothetical protein